MNRTLFQRAMIALATALVTFVTVRRWRSRIQPPSELGNQLDDAIRVQLPSTASQTFDTALDTMALPTTPVLDDLVDDDNGEEGGQQTRKVSRDRRIKYQGRRYGPFPETLIGQYVHIDAGSDTLEARYDGQIVASFLLSDAQ